MNTQHEDLITELREVWSPEADSLKQANQVIDYLEVRLEQIDTAAPILEPAPPKPEEPKNGLLAALRHRLKNRTPYKERFKGDRPSLAQIPIERCRDLRDVMRQATLAQVEEAIEVQRKHAVDLHYAEQAASELLRDMQSIKSGTAGLGA